MIVRLPVNGSGKAINYGAGPANLGGADQFAQTQACPPDGVFPDPTYCDTIIS